MRTRLPFTAILVASMLAPALALALATRASAQAVAPAPVSGATPRAATPAAPASAAAAAGSTTLSGVDALEWMAGCWAQTRPDGLTEEHWMKPSGGTMLGMSRTVRRGRTTAYEFLQIRDVGGKLAYVAKPSGQDETPFALKTLADGEVVFENPTHDYPQRIMYRRHVDGSLTARIEGTKQGQVRGVDFPYKRCQ